MKAKDLRDRTEESLQELEKSLRNDSFQAQFKNFTNRLNDTAQIKRNRRDIARIRTILTERANKKAEG
ncbi:MAG: 50S ribosomal protein L29 [Polyangiaceae bacterium]